MIATWCKSQKYSSSIVHDCEDDDSGENHDGDGDDDDGDDDGVHEDEDDDGTSPKTPIHNTSSIVNDCAIFPLNDSLMRSAPNNRIW